MNAIRATEYNPERIARIATPIIPLGTKESPVIGRIGFYDSPLIEELQSLDHEPHIEYKVKRFGNRLYVHNGTEIVFDAQIIENEKDERSPGEIMKATLKTRTKGLNDCYLTKTDSRRLEALSLARGLDKEKITSSIATHYYLAILNRNKINKKKPSKSN